MMTWFRAHRRAFATAGHYLGLSPLSSLLSIIAIGIALALPTAGFWLLDNIEQVGNSLSETHEISLFLHYEASQKDVDEIKNRLKNTTAL